MESQGINIRSGAKVWGAVTTLIIHHCLWVDQIPVPADSHQAGYDDMAWKPRNHNCQLSGIFMPELIEFVAWVHSWLPNPQPFSFFRASTPASEQWRMNYSIPNDALAGLADRWESFAPIRQRFREEGGLLLWPTKDTVGLPSMKLEHF